MNEKIIEDKDTSKKFSLAAKPEQLKKAKETVLKQLGKNLSVEGFRKGKAPADRVEKALDKQLLESEFISEALNIAFSDLAKKHKLKVISQPQVTVKKFVPFDQLEFEVQVEVVPPISLGDYKNLKVERQSVEVTKDDISKVINDLKSRVAGRSKVERASKLGDELIIDFEGVDKDKKKVVGASAKDYKIVLGSKVFIPGFEDELIGLKAAESKEFTIKFPADYGHRPLANQPVTFNVLIKSVEEIEEIEEDEKFVSQVGPFKTLKELKADIEKSLTSQKEQESQTIYRDKLVNALVEQTNFELPSTMVDQQTSAELNEFTGNLISRGMTMKEYLDQTDSTEDEFVAKELRPKATKKVKAGLILAEIAEKEDITVSKDELDIRLQLLKDHYSDPKMQQELDSEDARRDIISRMITEKTIDKLISYQQAS